MPYTAPAAVTSGAVISKTTFGDVVIADLNFLANPPLCIVTHNANQSFADNTEATPAFNTETRDTNGMHDTVTNNSRITIATAGVYWVEFNLEFTGRTDYISLYAYVRLNGGTAIRYASHGAIVDAGVAPALGKAFPYPFGVGDYIELRAYQNNTANAAANILSLGSNRSPSFSATWIGLG